MKRLGMAMVGVAALTFATVAQAAPSINYNVLPSGSFTAPFTSDPKEPGGAFDELFTSFTITQSGMLSASLITIGFLPSTNLDFSFAEIIGPFGTTPLHTTAYTISKSDAFGGVGDALEVGAIAGTPIGPGTYQLHVVGSNTGEASNSSYSGTINFTAVPEPAAWALMILGFGAVGFAMRRQHATYRVAYS